MKILITGVCGFIGHAAYRYFTAKGHEVQGIDDLSRPGSEDNEATVENLHVCHVANIDEVGDVVLSFEPDIVLHFAAQVAVTKSIKHPSIDFACNAMGTFTLLECCRRMDKPPMVLYASTNKVYTVHDLDILSESGASRYKYRPGIEWGPKTPYGVSKAVGDMYVREYASTYGMQTCCFRQSCIYGATQSTATEDQGWVAFIVKQYMKGETINVFGTGKQVRDLLYVDDLIRAYEIVMEEGPKRPYYDIGGGWDNTLSVNELLGWLSKRTTVDDDVVPMWQYHDWRPHDQKVYVADIWNFCNDYDWEPTVTVDEGLKRLVESDT